MRSRQLAVVIALAISVFIIVGLLYTQMKRQGSEDQGTAYAPPGATESGLPRQVEPSAVPSPSDSAPPSAAPDLSADANGLSKSTVLVRTNKGDIRFKLYSNDAPNTVRRMAELISQGFYNGLTFHRVEPGFVIQGGDPVGNGTGGSGQKQKAEFNSRKHVEGTVAMARAADPDSADSQFYISLGTHPHLDRNYTVFGQVIDGMDVARKIEKGDKMLSVTFQ
jgi:cyclophilin family peptidyl-prolyl cis-trans isomerase